MNRYRSNFGPSAPSAASARRKASSMHCLRASASSELLRCAQRGTCLRPRSRGDVSHELPPDPGWPKASPNLFTTKTVSHKKMKSRNSGSETCGGCEGHANKVLLVYMGIQVHQPILKGAHCSPISHMSQAPLNCFLFCQGWFSHIPQDFQDVSKIEPMKAPTGGLAPIYSKAEKVCPCRDAQASAVAMAAQSAAIASVASKRMLGRIGCGSNIGVQHGTLANGKVDYNLPNPKCSILTHRQFRGHQQLRVNMQGALVLAVSVWLRELSPSIFVAAPFGIS